MQYETKTEVERGDLSLSREEQMKKKKEWMKNEKKRICSIWSLYFIKQMGDIKLKSSTWCDEMGPCFCVSVCVYVTKKRKSRKKSKMNKEKKTIEREKS